MDKNARIDVLGIISIAFALSGVLSPIGLIVGIIGERQAKKTKNNYSSSRIGWIFNLALLVLGVGWIISVLLTGTYKAGS